MCKPSSYFTWNTAIAHDFCIHFIFEFFFHIPRNEKSLYREETTDYTDNVWKLFKWVKLSSMKKQLLLIIERIFGRIVNPHIIFHLKNPVANVWTAYLLIDWRIVAQWRIHKQKWSDKYPTCYEGIESSSRRARGGYVNGKTKTITIDRRWAMSTSFQFCLICQTIDLCFIGTSFLSPKDQLCIHLVTNVN